MLGDTTDNLICLLLFLPGKYITYTNNIFFCKLIYHFNLISISNPLLKFAPPSVCKTTSIYYLSKVKDQTVYIIE